MTSLRSYLLNYIFHLTPRKVWAPWLLGEKQILKGLLYLLSLARLWIGTGGSGGFCGRVFIVYAFYLSLINTVLMSAVTDTGEQRSCLTQCADNFLPTFKASERRETLPLVCVFEPEQEDRCSRKTHTKPKLSICVPPLLLMSTWKPSSSFQCAIWGRRMIKDLFFSITIQTHISPRWGFGIHMQIRHRGHWVVSRSHTACGYPVQLISVMGLLFANDRLSDKWCATNFVIMQLELNATNADIDSCAATMTLTWSHSLSH